MRIAICFVAAVGVARAASADPIPEDLTALRSQVGWGASLNPDRVALTSEGGWNGADRRASAYAVVEARLYAGLSVVGGAQYGDADQRARPTLGLAYQVIDPRHSDYGLRVSFTYKPEGLDEVGGELESVAVLSRRIGDDAVRGMLAYGRDPEGHESDAEVGASYVHRASEHVVVGGTARYRRALAAMTGEPAWDAITGLVGGIHAGHVRCEGLVGGESLELSGMHNGVVGLVSLGYDL